MKFKKIGRSIYDEQVWIDAMTNAIASIIKPGSLCSDFHNEYCTELAARIAASAAGIADAAVLEYQKRTPPEDE